ncbi:MAG: carbohydrate kinase family protein [Dehalococcoidales bacterium]|nr:carbohydrate kinase family protein [Dehalococcoidales bacterium]
MSNIEIIGLGALNIDNIYRVERILEDGEALVDEVKSFPGGSAANTIYGLSKLGIETGFVGVVGDDDEGRLLIQGFDKTGVDTSHIIVKTREKTGITLCLSDFSGKRSIYVIPGANNSLSLDDIDLSYINEAMFLHISSFADERQFQLLLDIANKITPPVKVGFSPGELYVSQGLKTLSPILSKVNTLFINQNELRILTGKDVIAGAEICLENGCQIVVVTLGKGKKLFYDNKSSAICYIRDVNREYLIEPPGITETCVDTTGAGDAFAAGFLYGFLNNKGLEECGQLGNIVAQFSITKIGARQGLPTLTQLAQRYFELYNRQL